MSITAPPGTQLPFTPRAKGILDAALQEAVRRGDSYIGIEHLLCGLLGLDGPEDHNPNR